MVVAGPNEHACGALRQLLEEAAGGAAQRTQYRIRQEITVIAAELANVRWATQNPEILEHVKSAKAACDRVNALLASLTVPG